MTNKNYLIERYKKYELEDELEQLKRENNQLKKENKKIEKQNKKLKKENKHFKSTKAYKVWKSYAKIKGEKPKKDKSKKSKPQNKKLKTPKEIKVALISDQFTYDSFKYEFDIISLNPKTWKNEIDKGKPDLFLCESTWDGHNFKSKTGPWTKKVVKNMRTNKETRKTLFKIIEYCKKKNIPTIFWNKEDPPHYRNERWSFAETAQYFDYIFTTSEECIPQYKKDFNHPHVYPLKFAGQPKIFNPLKTSDDKIEEIVFAGTYNANHKERVIMMREIFDRIINQWHNIRIYDRQYYTNDRFYPKKYHKYILPSIPYDETSTVYKKMKWGLNFNTVTQSRTMFARRVFELSLTNTLILTNYSVGVEEIFKDNVFYFDRIKDLPDFNGNYEDKLENNLYNVLENHTCAQRWREILDRIGFEYIEEKEDITIIYKVNNPDSISSIVKNFNEINYSEKTLKIIISKEYLTKLDIFDKIKINEEELKNKKEREVLKEYIDSIKEKYSEIDKIYVETNENYKKQMKKNIKSKYWLIASENIEKEFIRKALLHYKYLNKRISISKEKVKGKEKYSLDIQNSIENIVISRKMLNYLDSDENEVEIYYI